MNQAVPQAVSVPSSQTNHHPSKPTPTPHLNPSRYPQSVPHSNLPAIRTGALQMHCISMKSCPSMHAQFKQRSDVDLTATCQPCRNNQQPCPPNSPQRNKHQHFPCVTRSFATTLWHPLSAYSPFIHLSSTTHVEVLPVANQWPVDGGRLSTVPRPNIPSHTANNSLEQTKTSLLLC